jgi:hypothetical protein
MSHALQSAECASQTVHELLEKNTNHSNAFKKIKSRNKLLRVYQIIESDAVYLLYRMNLHKDVEKE